MSRIANYERPQHKISIRRRLTPAAGSTTRRPVVIGAQRLLALNDGRALPATTFTTGGLELFYRYLDNVVTADLNLVTHTVDQESVRIFGRDLLAEVFSESAAFLYGGADNELVSAANNFSGGTLNASLGGRALQVGDVLDVEVDNTTAGAFVAADDTFRRRVTAVLPKLLPPTVNGESTGSPDATPSSQNAPSNAADDFYVVGAAPTGWSATGVAFNADVLQAMLAHGGRYNGMLGERVVLTVTSGGSNTTAVFEARQLSAGRVESVTSVAGASANEFKLVLTEAGGPEITLAVVAATVSVGQSITVDIFQEFTAAGGDAFNVEDVAALTDKETSRTYFVTVVKGGEDPDLRITDSTGSEPVQLLTAVAVETSYPLGTKGLSFEMPAAVDLAAGDVFSFVVVASAQSTSEFNRVRLDGPVLRVSQFNTTNGRFRVTGHQSFSGELTQANAQGGAPYTVAADSVTLAETLGVPTAKTGSPFAAFLTGAGSVLVEFTAVRLPQPEDSVFTISTPTELLAELGELHPRNALAFGVNAAFSGSDGAPISVLRTAGDAAADYTNALTAIEHTDAAYALTPMTDNPAVIETLLQHAQAQSTNRRKRWRVVFAGVDTAGRWTLWNVAPDQKATLIDSVVTLDATTQEFRAFDNEMLGAVIKFGAFSDDFTITEVLSDASVRVSATSVTIPSDSEFYVEMPDTPANRRRYVKTIANLSNSELLNLVWTDRGQGIVAGSQQILSNVFVAAELAGARAYELPQKPLTNLLIKTFVTAPRMYTAHSEDELNNLAAEGVTIITQDAVGSPILVRHQLTTRAGDGPLFYEGSLVSVAHELAARRRNVLADLIGQTNLTPELISLVRARLQSLSFAATQTSLTDRQLGPLALSFTDEHGNDGKVTVAPHPTLRDSLRMYVRYQVPSPFNGADDYVDIELADPFSFA